jgi:hypothetical protein
VSKRGPNNGQLRLKGQKCQLLGAGAAAPGHPRIQQIQPHKMDSLKFNVKRHWQWKLGSVFDSPANRQILQFHAEPDENLLKDIVERVKGSPADSLHLACFLGNRSLVEALAPLGDLDAKNVNNYSPWDLLDKDLKETLGLERTPISTTSQVTLSDSQPLVIQSQEQHQDRGMALFRRRSQSQVSPVKQSSLVITDINDSNDIKTESVQTNLESTPIAPQLDPLAEAKPPLSPVKTKPALSPIKTSPTKTGSPDKGLALFERRKKSAGSWDDKGKYSYLTESITEFTPAPTAESNVQSTTIESAIESVEEKVLPEAAMASPKEESPSTATSDSTDSYKSKLLSIGRKSGSVPKIDTSPQLLRPVQPAPLSASLSRKASSSDIRRSSGEMTPTFANTKTPPCTPATPGTPGSVFEGVGGVREPPPTPVTPIQPVNPPNTPLDMEIKPMTHFKEMESRLKTEVGNAGGAWTRVNGQFVKVSSPGKSPSSPIKTREVGLENESPLELAPRILSQIESADDIVAAAAFALSKLAIPETVSEKLEMLNQAPPLRSRSGTFGSTVLVKDGPILSDGLVRSVSRLGKPYDDVDDARLELKLDFPEVEVKEVQVLRRDSLGLPPMIPHVPSTPSFHSTSEEEVLPSPPSVQASLNPLARAYQTQQRELQARISHLNQVSAGLDFEPTFGTSLSRVASPVGRSVVVQTDGGVKNRSAEVGNVDKWIKEGSGVACARIVALELESPLPLDLGMSFGRGLTL